MICQAKAAARPLSPGSGPERADLAELERRARDVLDHGPADLVRARALVAAYLAYLGSGGAQPKRAMPDAGGAP